MPAKYTVLIDWNNDGVDGSDLLPRGLAATDVDAAEDVTAWVRLPAMSLTMDYGRDQARSYSPPRSGKASFALDNSDGRFSSQNTGSPLYGYINPGINCKVRVDLNGLAYYLHDGYLDIPTELPGIRQQLINEMSMDGLTKLKQAVISTQELTGVTIDVAIGACLDAAGWPSAARALSTADTTLARWCVDNIDAFSAIRALVFTEGANAAFYVNPLTGYATFENRSYRWTQSRCLISQMTAVAQGTEPIFGQEFSFDPGVRSIINTCVVPVNTNYTDSALGVVWTGPTPETLAPNEARKYTVVTSAAWMNTGTVPVAGTDYTLTAGAVTPTLSRTSGKRFVLTMTAGAGGAAYTGLQVRAKTVSFTVTYVGNTISGAATNGVDYGTKTLPDEFVPAWLPSVATATDYCNWIVSRYKDPVPQVRFVLNSQNDTRLAAALARRFSDRITVQELLRSFTNGDFFVEQIMDTVSPGGQHQRVFGCEQAQQQAAWLLGVAGYSELGVTTRLVY